MTNEQIKAIFLANGFKEKLQGEDSQGDCIFDLNPYVYDAARALLAAALAQEAGPGEPVAIVTGSSVQWLPGAGKVPDRSALYAEQPAPVAVLLPDRPDAIIEGVMTSVGISHAIYACTVSLKDREQVKLYRNRPALMALPERKATIAFGEPDIRGEAWNACLDKVKELNQ